MLIKNATIYTLENVTKEQLCAAVANKPFTECNSLDVESYGFVPLTGKDELVHWVGNVGVVVMRHDKKVLPGAVIRAASEQRINEIEEAEVRKVGKKERKEIVRRVTDELLGKAFILSSYVQAWFDLESEIMVVDSASAGAVERLACSLYVDDGAKILPTMLPGALQRRMIQWITDEAPEGITVDRSATFYNADDNHIKLDVNNMQEYADTIKDMACLDLAVTFKERESFRLTCAGNMRGIKFLDVKKESPDRDDMFGEEKFVAELLISVGLVRSLRQLLIFELEEPICDESVA